MKFLRKKKLVVMVAAGLAGISLGSVGFAGWVINATTVANHNASVKFGDVTNNSYFAQISDTDPKALNLSFDSRVKGKGENNKIVGDAANEVLNVSFSFTIKNSSSKQPGDKVFAAVPNFNVKFESTLLSGLITANLIQSPHEIGGDGALINLSKTKVVSSVTADMHATYSYTKTHDVNDGIKVLVEYHFAWGSQFEYKNPQDCTVANAEAGLATLKEKTKDNLSSVLNITITPVLA